MVLIEMKYYNPSNNFRAPIPREPKPYRPTEVFSEIIYPKEVKEHDEKTEVKEEKSFRCEAERSEVSNKIEFSRDDLVILGVLFLLVFNSCDDYFLLAVLGYLFLTGRKKETVVHEPTPKS